MSGACRGQPNTRYMTLGDHDIYETRECLDCNEAQAHREELENGVKVLTCMQCDNELRILGYDFNDEEIVEGE